MSEGSRFEVKTWEVPQPPSLRRIREPPPPPITLPGPSEDEDDEEEESEAETSSDSQEGEEAGEDEDSASARSGKKSEGDVKNVLSLSLPKTRGVQPVVSLKIWQDLEQDLRDLFKDLESSVLNVVDKAVEKQNEPEEDNPHGARLAAMRNAFKEAASRSASSTGMRGLESGINTSEEPQTLVRSVPMVPLATPTGGLGAIGLSPAERKLADVERHQRRFGTGGGFSGGGALSNKLMLPRSIFEHTSEGGVSSSTAERTPVTASPRSVNSGGNRRAMSNGPTGGRRLVEAVVGSAASVANSAANAVHKPRRRQMVTISIEEDANDTDKPKGPKPPPSPTSFFRRSAPPTSPHSEAGMTRGTSEATATTTGENVNVAWSMPSVPQHTDEERPLRNVRKKRRLNTAEKKDKKRQERLFDPTPKEKFRLLDEKRLVVQESEALTRQQDTLQFMESSLPLHHRIWWLMHDMVASKAFQVGMTVMIVLNVAMIAYQADWAVQHPNDDTPGLFYSLDISFTVVFAIELVLRVLTEGLQFFFWSNTGFARNMFDVFVVTISLLEEALRNLSVDMPNVASMRALRACRLVRMIRILRVAKTFHDLRIMVNGILMSMRSLMWASVLLVLMGLVFGVIVLEFVSSELSLIEEDPVGYAVTFDGDLESFKANLKQDWGSLITAIYTLYKAISGGLDWGDPVETLVHISPFFAVLFCLYVSVATFCVLNIITGVFVENTKNMLAQDETNMIMETLEKRRQWMGEVLSLWATFSGEDEELNFEAFRRGMEDTKVQALFRKLGIDVDSENCEGVEGLFDLLDFNHSNSIDMDEFAMGIQMLHGTAKNIDMARLRHGMNSLRLNVAQIGDCVEALCLQNGVMPVPTWNGIELNPSPKGAGAGRMKLPESIKAYASEQVPGPKHHEDRTPPARPRGQPPRMLLFPDTGATDRDAGEEVHMKTSVSTPT